MLELAASLVGLLVLLVPAILSRVQERRAAKELREAVEEADAHLSLKVEDPVAGRMALSRQLELLQREARRKAGHPGQS